ncbi:MAG: hypothetical protein M3Q61_05820 [Chloroflexota bacterium]|nr:hypothetical protein [Chloroflexota bacterium]
MNDPPTPGDFSAAGVVREMCDALEGVTSDEALARASRGYVDARYVRSV